MERTVVEQVWNPTQHIALWLGAWATGYSGWDNTLDALEALGARAPISLIDANIPDTDHRNLLTLVRSVTAGGDWRRDGEPAVRLVLSGPGQVPSLPAGTSAATAAYEAGAAIVITDADPTWHHVIVSPTDGAENAWRWFSLEGPLPEPEHLSPGEADLMLADATRRAASALEVAHPGGALQRQLSDPRLMVGTLTDHFDHVAMPEDVPRRAGGLMARADQVAAILTVAQTSAHGAIADPQLIPLWADVRRARIAAVDYAVREWAGY